MTDKKMLDDLNNNPINNEKLEYNKPEFYQYGNIADTVQAQEGNGFDGGGGFPNDTRS